MENQNEQQVVLSVELDGMARTTLRMNKQDAEVIYSTVTTMICNLLNQRVSQIPASVKESLLCTIAPEHHEDTLQVHTQEPKLEAITELVACEPEVEVESPRKCKTPLSEQPRCVPIPSEVKHTNPFTHDIFTHKKVVGYTCPDCGKYTVRTMVLADSNETHCHFCRQPITIEKVTRIDVICPSCGDSFYVYGANGVKEIECKTCKSPIDVVYTKDNKHGKSANMSK